MEYKLSKAEAKVLIIASQSPVAENYADFLAVKLNLNSSYVAGMMRRLELAQKITLLKSGRRTLINNVDKTTIDEAKSLLSEDKKE